MVRDFNSKSSAPKKKSAPKKVKTVASASRVKKVGSHVTRKSNKKKPGFLNQLFTTNRTAKEMDYTFLLLVGVLVAFGLVMLLSASTPTANVKFGRSYHFFLRQLIFVIAGATLMIVCTFIDYRNLKRFVLPVAVIALVLSLLVHVPFIGVAENGARRWIKIAGIRLQPSEIMKTAIVLFFAALIDGGKFDIRDIKNGLSRYVLFMIVAVLPMATQHLSGTIVICGIVLCMLIVAGANVGLIVGGGGIMGALLVMAVALISPARMARLTSFFNPFTDMQGTGYQTAQSVYAIGSGGIFGKGLGESIQKFSYLPEPYNDFIFSVTCEELGLIGAVFLIGLFITLILRGIKIAMEADDVFGSMIVVGIMAHVAIQTILNIGVATASIPNTGVSLPFFSYGGTAILMLLVEMGLVLSVSRYSSKKK